MDTVPIFREATKKWCLIDVTVSYSISVQNHHAKNVTNIVNNIILLEGNNCYFTVERKTEIRPVWRVEEMVTKSVLISSSTGIIQYTFVLIVKVSKSRCFLLDKMYSVECTHRHETVIQILIIDILTYIHVRVCGE